jgi:hypothetical protein
MKNKSFLCRDFQILPATNRAAGIVVALPVGQGVLDDRRDSAPDLERLKKL